MKKCCKNVNILADDFIEDPIYEALDEKWKRPDVAKYLHGRTSSMSLQAMKRLLRDTDERDLMVSGLIRTVAESLRYEIQNRELKVEPIQYGWRRDGINGKFREIGVESVKQLILLEKKTGLSSICKYQRKRTTRRQKSNRASDQKEICSISVCLEGRCKEMLSIG